MGRNAEPRSVAAALDFVTMVMVIARAWRTGQAGRPGRRRTDGRRQVEEKNLIYYTRDFSN